MKTTELLRKCGYRKRCTDGGYVIYDLIEKQEYGDLPDTFSINLYNYTVEFSTELEQHAFLGTCYINIDSDLWQAINQKIEELKNKKVGC